MALGSQSPSTTSPGQSSTIDDYAEWLSDGVSKPAAKFLKDMIRGIHAARSVKLADVARVLGEDSHLHATHKRLSRNLARQDLTTFVADRLLAQGARAVKRDTRLVVHTYSLDKRYARKMEYLRDTVDSPDPQASASNGYRVCEIIAGDAETNTYVPLLTTCWSRFAPGFVSNADEIMRAVRRVVSATEGRGVVCVNERTVAPRVIGELIEQEDIRFNVSLHNLDPEVVHNRQSKTAREVFDGCEVPYGATIYKVVDGAPFDENGWGVDASGNETENAIFIHFGSRTVRLPDSDRPLCLIAVKTSDGLGLPFLTSDGGLRSRKAVLETVVAQMTFTDAMWAHNRHKQGYQLDGFRVMTFGRLQLLMTLLQAVVYFETRGPLTAPYISLQPHAGDYERDYLLPGDVERASAAAGS